MQNEVNPITKETVEDAIISAMGDMWASVRAYSDKWTHMEVDYWTAYIQYTTERTATRVVKFKLYAYDNDRIHSDDRGVHLKLIKEEFTYGGFWFFKRWSSRKEEIKLHSLKNEAYNIYKSIRANVGIKIRNVNREYSVNKRIKMATDAKSALGKLSK